MTAVKQVMVSTALAGWAALAAAQSIAQVESFSPEGEAPGARQVAIRFDQDMVPLGRPGAPAPIAWRCEGEGVPLATGRWVDARRWVLEFPHPLPPGVRCDAGLRVDLRSLAGTPVAAQGPFQFTTGGPKAQWLHAPRDGEAIAESQVFFLRANAPVRQADLRSHLQCVVDGTARPAELLDLPEARVAWQELLRRDSFARWQRELPQEALAVRCTGGALPAGARLRLVWGKAIATPGGVASVADQTIGEYRVRGPLQASIACARLEPGADCDYRQPVRLRFSELVPRTVLQGVSFTDEAGAPLPSQLDDREAFAREVTLPAPPTRPVFGEGAAVHVRLPAAVVDIDGRPLANAQEFPRRVPFALLPPYLEFVQWKGVVPQDASRPARWPLATRRLEAEVPVQVRHLDGTSRASGDGDALSLRALASARVAELWGRGHASAAAIAASDAGNVPWSSQSVRQVATASGPMEFVAIELDAPGLYLLHADSERYRARRLADAAAAGRPPPAQPGTASVVLVTNLHVATRIALRGESLVWVTALDSGVPVAGAEVDIIACDGAALAQGSTGVDGLFRTRVPLRELRTCPLRHAGAPPQGNSLSVVVRQGRDLAVVEDGGTWWPAREAGGVGHTVLDRTLFKPGETVHMHHLVRRPTERGFEAPAAGPGEVAVFHGRDRMATLPLAWDAEGHATTRWTVPADARLGGYRLVVRGPQGSSHEASLSVEEFRSPVFEAGLEGAARWLRGGQELPLALRLDFLAGGGAGGQPVELQGAWSPLGEPPIAGFSFRDPTVPFERLPDLRRSLRLDGHGRRATVLRAPPLVQPAELRLEMKFADANGETQTHGATFRLWAAETVWGVRVQPQPGPGGVGTVYEVTALALDAGMRPQAGRNAALSVQRAQRSSGQQEVQPVGDALPLCQGRTDARGELRCTANALPAWSGGDSGAGWLFRVRGEERGAVSSAQFLDRWTAASRRESGVLQLLSDEPLPVASVARVQLQPPFLPARALFTLEREGVLRSWQQELTAPESVVEVPIYGGDAPGAQLHATFVRGTAHGGPSHAGHEIELKVAPTAFVLEVDVRPAQDEVAPGSTLAVHVRAQRLLEREPAAGARLVVIAVDEALLALKGNPSWQVLQHMLRPRRATVQGTELARWLTLRRALGPQPLHMPWGDIGAGRAPHSPAASAMKRWDDEADPARSHLRRNFSPLAFWSTEVVLDARGEARVQVPVNDGITRWRIVAVALQGADRFGTGEAAVRTSQPVQLFAGLPPVVRQGDTLRLEATLRNAGSRPLQLRVVAQVRTTVENGDAMPAVVAADQRLPLAPGATRKVHWHWRVPEPATSQQWTLRASLPDGRPADALEAVQRVVPALPVTTRQATLLRLQGDARVPLEMPAAARPGQGGIHVGLRASLVAGALAEAQRWMAEFPHRSIEHRASLAAVQGDVAAWEALMAELPRQLDGPGLVRFFPGSPGSALLTAHVLDLAHANGWPIPDALRQRMLQGLARVLVQGGPEEWMPPGQRNAWRLALQATLAEQGAWSSAWRPVRPEDPGRLPALALVHWARTVLAQPVRDPVELRRLAALLRARYEVQGTRLAWRDEQAEHCWWFMGTGDLSAARLAQLLPRLRAVDASWDAEYPLVVQGLVGRQVRGRWVTAPANAWAATALRGFAAEAEGAPVQGQTRVALAVRQPQVQAVQWPDGGSVLLSPPRPGERPDLHLVHTGQGQPWATVALRAAIRTTQPVASGLRVEKRLVAIEQRVPGRWSVGDVVRVQLRLKAASPLTWVALQDPVPSGATILGRGLARESVLARRGEWGSSISPEHEERAADGFRAWFERVAEGTWGIDYTVRLNNAGTFRLPPTRVEATYAPEIFGEWPNADVRVGP